MSISSSVQASLTTADGVIKAALAFIAILYAGKYAPDVPDVVDKFYRTTAGKIVLLVAVFMVGRVDLVTAALLAIVLVLIWNYKDTVATTKITEGLENLTTQGIVYTGLTPDESIDVATQAVSQSIFTPTVMSDLQASTATVVVTPTVDKTTGVVTVPNVVLNTLVVQDQTTGTIKAVTPVQTVITPTATSGVDSALFSVSQTRSEPLVDLGVDSLDFAKASAAISADLEKVYSEETEDVLIEEYDCPQ